MSSNKFSPTQSIQKVIYLIENLISSLIQESGKIILQNDFQQNRDIPILVKVLIRNIESIICLCGNDLLLLPSALIIARSTLEIAVNILWIIDPQDKFEREIRLIAFIKDEYEDSNKYIRNWSGNNIPVSVIKELEMERN